MLLLPLTRSIQGTAWFGLLLLATGRPGAPAPPPEPAAETRLLVLVVVDQMIPEQLDRLAPWCTGGFRRFMDRGEVWVSAAHGHGITETGPGHATIGTGVYPRRHGIVANHWLAPEEAAYVYCAVDEGVQLLSSDGAEGEGRSPVHLEEPGFSDHLKAVEPEAKCVGVAAKDRAAILATGRSTDWSLWWGLNGEGFVSSTWYGPELPPWVNDWNARWRERLRSSGADGFSWNGDLPPDIAKAGTAADARRGEASLRGRTEFPHGPPTGDFEPRVAASFIFNSPYADRFTVAMAERAVVEMDLGGDEHPDFLFVGLSACDAIGHHFGPYSAETTDLLLQADRALGELFALLDERVGPERWVAALTADHGVMELPERLRARGIPARRVFGTALGIALAKTRAALREDHGDDFYVGFGGGIRFSAARAAAAGIDGKELHAAAAALLAEAGSDFIERTFPLEDLLPEPSDPARDPLRTLMSRSAFAGRSPDVLFVGKRGQIVALAGTTHGSPWAYDRRVPIAFLGPGTTPGRRWEPCAPVDVLPTLFHRAGLAVPERLDGRVLE